jgi:hypothetical protein
MVQKKRKQASDKQDTSKRQKQDGQKAVSKDISVPIDEGFKENGKSDFLTTSPIPSPPSSTSSTILTRQCPTGYTVLWHVENPNI